MVQIGLSKPKLSNFDLEFEISLLFEEDTIKILSKEVSQCSHLHTLEFISLLLPGIGLFSETQFDSS